MECKLLPLRPCCRGKVMEWSNTQWCCYRADNCLGWSHEGYGKQIAKGGFITTNYLNPEAPTV